MKIIRTKLYQGKWFEIRSYELEQAQKNKENIYCFFGNEKMTLTPEKQKTLRLQIIKDPYPSKIFPGTFYYLYDYAWNPDKPPTEEDKLKRLSLSL